MNHRTTSKRLRTRILAPAIALAMLLAPALALAATWSQGTKAKPFASVEKSDVVSTTIGGKSAVVLERKILWEYKSSGLFEPLSAQPLDGGDVLVVDAAGDRVVEVNHAKKVVWSYGSANDSRITRPTWAQRLENGNTLIIDKGADLVLEVTPGKDVVWQYGFERDSQAPGCLAEPYSASRLSNGNTLIVDRGSMRVIEVRTSDYKSGEANYGFTDASIVWQYGGGSLSAPKTASRLSSGNTLIVDSQSEKSGVHRVLEVSKAGSKVWEFSSASAVKSGVKPLADAADATKLSNGHVAIAEEGSDGRVFEVDKSGKYVSDYSVKSLLGGGAASSKLGSVHATDDGSLIFADQGNRRVVEVGYVGSGTITSGQLDLGLAGVSKKAFKFEAVSERPKNTAVKLEYSLDGGAWHTGGMSVPSANSANLVRYRVTLTTKKADVTPVLREVKISYELLSTTVTGDGAGNIWGGSGSGLNGFGTDGLGSGLYDGSGIASGSVMPTDSIYATGTVDTATAFAAPPPSGPRFTQGQLMKVVGTSGGSTPGVKGDVGRMLESKQAQLAVLFVGASYLTGLGYGWIGRGARTLLRFSVALIGRR